MTRPESAPERDYVEGELRHRDHLARNVVGAWVVTRHRNRVPSDMPDGLTRALDRLAAAYLPDNPQPGETP